MWYAADAGRTLALTLTLTITLGHVVRGHAGLTLTLTLTLPLTLGHVVRGPSWPNSTPNPDSDPNSRACGTRPTLVEP